MTLRPASLFVMAMSIPTGRVKKTPMRTQMMRAHHVKCVSHTCEEIMANAKLTTKTAWNHHSGASPNFRGAVTVRTFTIRFAEAGKENSRDARTVPAHQLQVNIRLLITGALGSVPDVATVEETAVDDGRHETREAHAVGKRKGRADQEGRVLLVRSLVESVVGGENARDVVRAAKMIVVGVCPAMIAQSQSAWDIINNKNNVKWEKRGNKV